MKSHIANVIDLEADGDRFIEVGLTTIDLRKWEVLKTYSMPIKPGFNEEVSEHVRELTGWTNSKLNRQGEFYDAIAERLSRKHGFSNRLLIVDHWSDAAAMRGFHPKLEVPACVMNVSDLYALRCNEYGGELSLNSMLDTYCMEFEGVPHRASWDSLNIAKLFLTIMNTY